MDIIITGADRIEMSTIISIHPHYLLHRLQIEVAGVMLQFLTDLACMIIRAFNCICYLEN